MDNSVLHLRNAALDYAIRTGTPPGDIVPTATKFLDFLQNGPIPIPPPSPIPPVPHPAESSPAPQFVQMTIVRYSSLETDSGECFRIHNVVYRHRVAIEVLEPPVCIHWFNTLAEAKAFATVNYPNSFLQILDYDEYFGPRHAS